MRFMNEVKYFKQGGSLCYCRGEAENRIKLNVDKWLEMRPISVMKSIVLVVRSNYGIPALNRAMLWPYCRCYINRFFMVELLKRGSKKSKG